MLLVTHYVSINSRTEWKFQTQHNKHRIIKLSSFSDIRTSCFLPQITPHRSTYWQRKLCIDWWENGSKIRKVSGKRHRSKPPLWTTTNKSVEPSLPLTIHGPLESAGQLELWPSLLTKSSIANIEHYMNGEEINTIVFISEPLELLARQI